MKTTVLNTYNYLYFGKVEYQKNLMLIGTYAFKKEFRISIQRVWHSVASFHCPNRRLPVVAIVEMLGLKQWGTN